MRNQLINLINHNMTPADATRLLAFLDQFNLVDRLAAAPGQPAKRSGFCYEGGLLDHTLEVIELTLAILRHTAITGNKSSDGNTNFVFGSVEFPLIVSCRDAVLAALLHDFYKLGLRPDQDRYVPNMLTKGRSEAEPWKVDHDIYSPLYSGLAENTLSRQRQFLLRSAFENNMTSTGDLSLALVYGLAPDFFKTLSEDVIFAVRYHDGLYGPDRSGYRSNETTLQLTLHYADMCSTRRAAQVEALRKSGSAVIAERTKPTK